MLPDLESWSVVLEVCSYIIALFKQIINVVSDFKKYFALIFSRLLHLSLFIFLDYDGVLGVVLDLGNVRVDHHGVVQAETELLALVVIEYLDEVSLRGVDRLSRVVQGNVVGLVKHFEDSCAMLI